MKKIISLLLSLIVCAGVLAGCNRRAPDTEETLEVYCVDYGYGTKWCNDLLDLFKKQDWVKEKYPNLNVLTPITNDVDNFAKSKLSNPSSNTIDLFFGKYLYDEAGPNGLLENLTESVYNSTVPGEDILYSDKIVSSYKDSLRFIDVNDVDADPEWYLTPWAGGMDSIIYNETILNSFDIKVPNTTDELVDACAAIKGNQGKNNGKYKEGYSFIQSKDVVTYFELLFPVWWAQYEGVGRYIDFWNGIDNFGRSVNIFTQEGRVKALEVFEEILRYSSGYLNPATYTFKKMTDAQTFFLKGQGGVFHANGDWFDYEMDGIKKDIIDTYGSVDTFKMMKVPVVSALGEKLGITDIQLSELVSYVDGITDVKPLFSSSTFYTEAQVIAAVREARSVVHSIGPDHTAVIPSYANGKEVAIDFLRFMATDIAQEQYIKSTKGASLPFNYNLKEKNNELYNSISDLQKGRHDYFCNEQYVINTLPSNTAFPLAVYGGLTAFIKEDYFNTFAANGNKKTPADYQEETIKAWTKSKWDTAVGNAGLPT